MTVLLTTLGSQKLTAAISGGAKLILSKFGVGDGNGNSYEPSSDQTQLKNLVWKGYVSSVRAENNHIKIQCIINESVGDFTIREIGIYDDANDLIIIANYPETVKTTAVPRQLMVNVVATIDNAENITVALPPTDAFITHEYLAQILEKYLPLSGGMLSGSLLLSKNPIDNLEAATKAYVDNKFGETTYTGNQDLNTLIADGVYYYQSSAPHNPLTSFNGFLIVYKSEDQTNHHIFQVAYVLDQEIIEVQPIFYRRSADNGKTWADWQSPLLTSGGILSGQVTMEVPPTEDHHLTTKVYVDEAIKHRSPELADYARKTDLADYLPLNGGNLTGPLKLSRDPKTETEAATKAYADTKFGLTTYIHTQDVNTLTIPGIYAYQSGANNIPISTSGGFLLVYKGEGELARYIFQASYVVGQSNGSFRPQYYRRSSDFGETWSEWETPLLTRGGTMLGALTLASDPTATLHAATKGYVDNALKNIDVDLSGYATKTELNNYALSSALNNYLSLSGGSLTGNIRPGDLARFQGYALATIYGITSTSNATGYNLASWGGGNERLSLVSLHSGSPVSTSSQASGAITFNCVYDADGVLKTNVSSGAHLIEGTRSGGWTFRSTPSLEGGTAVTVDHMITTFTTGYSAANFYVPLALHAEGTATNHAVTKGYTDNKFLPLVGGTVTGQLNIKNSLIVDATGVVNLGSSTGGTTVPRTASIVSGGTINIGVATSATIACNSATVSAGQAAAMASTGAVCEGNNSAVIASASAPTASGPQSAILGGASGKASGTSSVIIGSNIATASGTNATILGSTRSEVHANQSAIIASVSSTIPQHTDSSCSVIMGSQGSQSTGARAGVYSSQNSTASGSRSAIFGSYYGTTSGTGSILLGSMATLLSENYAVGYGYGAGTTPLAANLKFKIKSTGEIQASGAFNGGTTFTDYAEFFENETLGILPLGSIVALSGRYVRLANANDDDILGVVSGTYVNDETGSYFTGTSLITGGDSPFTWSKRYLTGEFGQRLYETIPDPNWDPEEHEEGSEAPLMSFPIENPDFNPDEENIPRSHRPEEWTCVGLMGQLYVRVDETVEVGQYVIPDENGRGTLSLAKASLRCMDITTAFDATKGYGVALCLMR